MDLEPIASGELFAFPQLFEGIIVARLVENLLVQVVDYAIPLAGLNAGGDEGVLAHDVLKLRIKFAINPHTIETDGFLLDRGKNVLAEVLVSNWSGAATPVLPSFAGL